jgi:hypothetical protein
MTDVEGVVRLARERGALVLLGEGGFKKQIAGFNGKCTEAENWDGSMCNQKLIGAQRFNAAWGGDAGVEDRLDALEAELLLDWYVPHIIGTQLSVNGRSFTVVGIMPANFEFPLPLFGVQGGTFAERADMWKPIAFTKQELESRGSRSYGVIGRLKPGVPLALAPIECMWPSTVSRRSSATCLHRSTSSASQASRPGSVGVST